jgi:hypothetical protein
MDYIDKYFEEVHYIVRALQNPKCSHELKTTIKVNIFKTMLIGASLSMIVRYSIHHKYYRFKNYVNSLLFGSLFGILYSPYFLVPKIDK